jgi:radical SAM superfamily enzyme YgiQ (UPF0313 family)
MDVLLVNTNRMKPAIAPIGLDYLADAIEHAGHTARLLDLCFSSDVSVDIEAAVRDFGPEVIGVTVRNTDDCYMSGGAFFLPEIKETVDLLRAHSGAPIVMGGVGFSVAPEAVLELCGADYGIAGEGEPGFVRLLTALAPAHSPSRGEGRGGGLDSVPGLVYRADGTIRRNPPADADLDTLPSRRRRFADNRRYFREGGQAGIETKRGCNMDCIYCADPVTKGRAVRLRSPQLVVDEIEALLDQGIDHLHTCDCEFNIPGSHAKDVCRAIADAGLGERVRWYAYCSVTPFDAEMADLMKRAGCVGIDFGADSGNRDMLRRLGRHFTPDDLVQTARLCHEHGITFMYDLLLGGPGETRESIRETIDLVRRIEPDCVGISMGVRIYDGTPLARSVRADGDPAANPSIYGAKENNPSFLRPIFYISPDVGPDIVSYVRDLVGHDPRFFLPAADDPESNYNYNENTLLVNAIAAGARGAYWHILHQLR